MTRFTRRDMLAQSALALVGASAASGATLSPSENLKDHAARAGLVYGAAFTTENWDAPGCRPLYERETAIVTTDLELKFAALRPSIETFNFEPADRLVGWARSAGLLVRGHTLIWNESNPDWLKRCSSREIARIFDQHIELVVSRYAGRIHTWDVVNEPFWPDHGAAGGYRRGPWFDALGPSYVSRALKRVRAIDPAAKLCINEAHCELDNSWGQGIRPCLARLVDELRQADVPLDAVGFQAHLLPGLPHDYPAFAAYARKIAALGVDLHITELDIDDASFPDPVPTRDRMAAAYTADFLKQVLAIPQIKMVINWELADPWSHYVHAALQTNSNALRLPRPLPFDDKLRPKPLMASLVSAFDARTRS